MIAVFHDPHQGIEHRIDVDWVRRIEDCGDETRVYYEENGELVMLTAPLTMIEVLEYLATVVGLARWTRPRM